MFQHARELRGKPDSNGISFIGLSIAHSTATLNYDIKLPADMDAKQFRGIKVSIQVHKQRSVPVRRGKWEAFQECLVAFILNAMNYFF